MNNRGRSVLVIIHGLPYCLKSTLAKDLSTILHFGLIGTAFFGTATYRSSKEQFGASRDRRYAACKTIAKSYLSAGYSVVVEGNFSQVRWRRGILDYCRLHRIPVALVRCWCSRPQEIRRRYLRRRSNRYSLDRGADRNAYELELASEILVKQLELSALTEYVQLDLDTGSWTLKTVRSRPGDQLGVVKKAVSGWVRYKKTTYD